jgi:hypothetical protein
MFITASESQQDKRQYSKTNMDYLTASYLSSSQDDLARPSHPLLPCRRNKNWLAARTPAR